MKKNTIAQILRNFDRNIALGNCFEGSVLNYEHVKRRELSAGLAAGRVSLENGYFTVGGVDVPEALAATQQIVERSQELNPKIGVGLHFGTWHDTTQEPPVETPAEMHTSERPGGAAGLMARVMTDAAVTISPIQY